MTYLSGGGKRVSVSFPHSRLQWNWNPSVNNEAAFFIHPLKEFEMKRHAVKAMGLFLVVTTLFLNSATAAEPSANRQGGIQENAQSRSMKKHSHMEDKGLPEPDRTSPSKAVRTERHRAANDKSRHLHPRDGK